MGREVVVAITDGRLDLGPWEAIFYGGTMAPQYWVVLTVEALVVFLIGYRIFQFYDQRVIKFL